MMKCLLSVLATTLCVTLVVGDVSDSSSVKNSNNNNNAEEERRFLSLPVPHKCSRRPKEFEVNGHHFFFSGNTSDHKNASVDWLDARNICREYCMDLVSIETQEENDVLAQRIESNDPDDEFCKIRNPDDVPYIWTSGRLCDFKGCETRKDLLPLKVNGWFWSGNRIKITPTNQTPRGWRYRPWSHTGNFGDSQPDNAEFRINKTPESCLAFLNNVYNDGLTWHDVACYHKKPFFCEDSEELLSYVEATNPGIRL